MSFLVKKAVQSAIGTSGPQTNPPANIEKVNNSIWEFCSPPNPDVDIIFFHGLQLGNYENAFWKTWRAKDDEQVVWPKDWLSKKLPNARIFSVSYNYSATESKGQIDMEALGENLVSDIIDSIDINIGQSRPVFLVGHSLGGIVIKQFLLSVKKKFREYKPNGIYQRSRDRISTFLDHFKGVFYYATPHRGSLVADSSLTEFAGKLLDTGYILRFLQTLDTKRGRINDAFSKYRKKMGFRAYAVVEGLDTKLYSGFSAKVVPEASATLDCDGNYVHGEADHFTVCQAVHENDPVVIGQLVQFILRADESIAYVPQRRNDEDMR